MWTQYKQTRVIDFGIVLTLLGAMIYEQSMTNRGTFGVIVLCFELYSLLTTWNVETTNTSEKIPLTV